MSGREWALLSALSVLWGGSFFFLKILVGAWPPLTVVLGRVGIAAVALNLLLILSGKPLWGGTSPRLWGSFLVMGLMNNVLPFTLITLGETRIASGLASILNATTPVFTVIVAHVATADEKLTPQKVAGVLFGFAGVAALIGPGVLVDLSTGDAAGQACCLLAAMVYALAGLYGRRFRGLAPLKIATGQVTASTIIMLPLALIVDHPWTLPVPGPAAWGALVGIALLSTALAYILFFRILATSGATNLLLVTFLLPVSALLLGATILGERIARQSIGGMMLIGLGLAAIDGRLWRASMRRLGLTRP